MRDTLYTTDNEYRPLLRVVLFRSPIVGTDARGPSLGSAMRASASIIVARVKLMRAFMRQECIRRDAHLYSIVAGNSTDELLGRRPSRVRILGQKGLCAFENSCPSSRPSIIPFSLPLRALSLSLCTTSNFDASLTSL